MSELLKHVFRVYLRNHSTWPFDIILILDLQLEQVVTIISYFSKFHGSAGLIQEGFVSPLHA